MTTSSTIPCKRTTTFVCLLVIVFGLFASHANAQVTNALKQQQTVGITNVQGASQNELTPTEVMLGCNCSSFSVCITSQVNVSCYGGDNGSATASASGGSSPYTYSWNTNPCQTKQTATGLSAGNYIVTVTDNMGCTATACVTITQGSSISIAIPTPSPICKGSKATLTVNGSTCISYTWSPSTGLSATTGSSVTADPTITTTYTVTGTTSTGCSGIAKVVVTVNPTTTINVTCPSAICLGSCASLKVSGSPCESYTWTPSTGLTVTTGSSISACPTATTTYTVTGSDNNGCPAIGYVVVTVNPATTISVTCPSSICLGSCALLKVSGSPCESYTWTPSTGLTVTTGSSISACPTATTTYTVTGSDNNGCPAKGYVVVTVNPTTTINVNTPSGICLGSCATLTVNGAPCTSYTWSPSSGLTVTTGSSISACPTITTTYTVTGSDHNGCTAEGYVTVSVNPTTTINVNTPSGICLGSCATLTVNGSPCASYTWTPSSGLTVTTGSSISACPTMTTTYTVTGSDHNGCPAKGYVVVNVNPTTTININTPSSICLGSCATLTVSGSPCTSYTWTPSSGLTVTTGSSISACPTMTTTYTVTGSDHNGCPAKGYVVVNVNPTTTINVNTPSGICLGSCATLTVSGSPCTSYTWTPSSGLTVTTGSSISACPTITTTYTVTGSDHNGCPAKGYVVVSVNPTTTINVNTPSSICLGSCATLTVSGSPCTSYTWTPSSGLTVTTGSSISACPTMTTTYTVTGSDHNGCPAKGYVTVTVNPTTTINVNTPSSICKGSCATLTVSGSPCTSYTWTPSTGLTVTTGSSISACPTMTTTYTVTGSDYNGCPAKGYVTVTVNPTTTINVNTPQPICNGTCATLTVSGSPCTTYTWTPSTGLTVTTGSSISACPTMTTTYTVTGSDHNGCSATGNVVVTVMPLPSVTLTVNDPTICKGGSDTLKASGLAQGGTYTWSPATGLSATTGSSVIANPTVTTTYTVNGTNPGGCTDPKTVVVYVNHLQISVTPGYACINDCANLTATGATYYTWSPATALSATTGSSVTACPGATTTYTIIGTNGSGCIDTTTTIVTIYQLPVIKLTAKTHTVCSGSPDTITASGASIYTWSPSTGLNVTTGSQVIASPTVTTTYTVIGINGNGCVCNDTIIIRVGNKPVITLQPRSNTMCAVNGQCDGHSFKILATGTNVYYQWYLNGKLISSGVNDTVYGFSPGVYADTGKYVVIVSNQCGADTSDTASFILVNSPVINVLPESVCLGSCTTLTATGTDAIYYSWSPSTGLSATTGSSVTACPTTNTTYTIIATGIHGCTDTATTTVTINPKPTIRVASDTICYGNCATLQAMGLNESGSYTWSPSAGLGSTTGTTVSACPTVTTTYTIIGVNGFGCSDTTTAVVLVNPKPVITAKSDTVCYGKPGVLTVSGASTYTWSPSIGLGSTTGSSVTVNVTLITTYTVIGTNTYGCMDTTTAVLKVNPKPVVTATSDTVCYGKTGVLTASGASTYAWSPAGGLSATTGSSVTVTVGQTTTYTVVGTNTNGCTDTTTAVLKVNPKPVVTATSDTVCYGKTGVLTASGASTYAWSPAGGLSATTGSSVTVTVGQTTTYTVIGTNAYGCTDTTTAVLKVNPKPIVTAKSDTVCYGNAGVLTASGASTYAWSPAGGLSSTTGSSVTVTVGQTTTYTVIGTNTYGCTDTTTAVLKVNPKPTIHVASDTICYGNCATLQATGLNESGSYTWSPSNGLGSTTGTTVSACPTITTTYTIIGVNGFGCSDTTTTVVLVNPKPTIHVASDTICYGNCATLQAMGLNESGSYTWSPSTGLGSTTGTTVSACPTITTTYTIVGTNGYGCSDTTTAVVKVDTLPIVAILGASCSDNYVTVSQGGWGTTCHGGNPGCFRDAHFATCFPSGISIGCSGGNTLSLTSDDTVREWFPQGTTPSVLPSGNMVDNLSYRNIFAGQLVAAELNVGFANCVAGYSGSIGNLVISSGEFAGMTVNQLISISNQVIGGCSTQYTPSDLTDALDNVNGAFDDGANTGYLTCKGALCVGSSDTLKAVGANSYVWSPSAGLNTTVGSEVIATPSVTTTYTVVGTNSNNCTDTTSIVVTVNPKPTIQVKSDTVCYGSCATLTANGASTYTWSPSTGLSVTTGSSISACPIITTTYTITGTNENGCVGTTTAVVLVNPKPVITAKSDTVCYGKQGVLTASGATTYTWSPSTGLGSTTGSSVTVNVTLTTTYTVVGTNTYGCTDTTTAVLKVNPKPVVTATSDTVCYGKTGVLTASGASTYAWSPAGGLSATTGSSVTVTVGQTTTYTVVGTNTYGCTDTTTAVLKVNPKPVVTATSDTVCYGKTGVLTASGASTYAWSPAGGLSATTGSSVTVTVGQTTTYTVIGTNAYGCTDTTTAVLRVNPKPIVTAKSDTVCYGNAGVLTASGATTYTWSPAGGLSATTGSSVTVTVGQTTTYTVIGTNTYGCTDTTTAVLKVNPKPTIHVASDTICYGNCAALQAMGLNESGSYTWSPSAGLGSTTGTTVSACPTITTTYTIIGVNGFGCSDTTTAVVLVNPKPVIHVASDTICYGNCATLQAMGLNESGSYTWSPSNGLGSTTGTTVSACPTITTTYTIIGVNGYGCSDTTTAVVLVNPKPVITATSDTVCYGKQGVLTASGATTYTWSPSTGLNASTGSSVTVTVGQTTTYTVIGTNTYGCTDTTTAVLKVNPKPTIHAASDTICYGNCATLQAMGLNESGSYTWSPSAGLGSTTGTTVSACPTITTTYTIIGVNGFGCSDTTTAVVLVNPKPVIHVASDTICYGNCATLQAMGLNESGSYTWSPSNGLGSTTGTTVSACPTITTTYTIIGVNGYGCSDTTTAVVLVNPKPVITATSDTVCYGKTGVLTASGASTYTWSPSTGLNASTGSSVTVTVGQTTTYTVIGTNTYGCTDTTTAVLRVNPKPVVTATSDTVCYGKTGVLTASGASTYAWSPAGGLSATTGSSVTVTVGQTTTYTVIGTNTYGCTDTTTAVLRVNPKPIVTAKSDTVCYGNAGVLTASGATTYTWSPAGGLSSTTGSSVTVTVGQTTTYTVIGTNTYGCTDTTTAVLKVNPKPTIHVASDTICYGNCATLQAMGLNESGSYTWSPSAGLGSTTGTTVSACPTVTTTYTIIGVNGFGCSDTTTAVVLVNPKPVITATSDTVCYGKTGVLTASGASTYTWSPAGGLSATTGSSVTVNVTLTTTYTVIGTNTYGCTDTTTAVLKVNPKPVITATSDTVCYGKPGVLTASGASTYAWSPAGGLSATTGSSVTVTVGQTTTYTVIGTNTYGCTDTTTAVLRVNPKPIVTAKSDTVCYGNAGVLTASGASTYAWSPTGGLSSTTGSSVTVNVGQTTTYTVIGTNTYGCTDTTTAVLKVNPKPTIHVASDTICYGNCATLQAMGLNESGSYTWSPSAGLGSTTGTTVSACPTITTTYTIIGVNGFGCSDTTTAVVLVNPKPVIHAASDTICYGNCATLQAMGLNESGSYTWSPSAGLGSTTGTTVSACPTITTTYTIIGVNGYGCSDTTTAVVLVNPKPVITANSDTVCYGKAGVLTVSGASTYTWSPAGGLSATTGSSVTVTVGQTTTYTVIGTNTYGCTDTTTAVLRVNPKPVVTATSDTVCYGKTGVLTASGASTYIWSPAGGLSSTTGSSVTVNVGQTTTYTVIGTNAYGCTDTTTAVLRVNPKPVIHAASDTICYGNCATLQAMGLNESGSYTWSPSAGLGSTTGTTVSACPTITTTYTIIGVNGFGCSDTTTAVVLVNPKPVIHVASDTICYGNCATLQAMGLNESGSYTWSPSAGLGSTTGTTVSACPTITTTYTIIGVNGYGCSDTTTAVVLVNPKPVITATSDTVCYGKTGVLTASGASTYTWSPAGGLSATTGSSVTVNVTLTTTYTVIGTNTYGCTDTTTAVLKVNPKPVITATSDTVCYGKPGVLTASGASTYAWSPAGGLSATTGSSVTVNVTLTTTYTVIGTNTYGCTDTTTAVLRINPKPVVTATSDTVCYGNAGVLTASGASTYAWSPTGGLSSTTGSSVTVNVGQTTTYTVIGTNTYGCTDTTTAVLKVNPKPTIHVASDTICYGNCATLQAMGLNESGSYTWSPSAGLGSTTGTTVSACPTITTTYTIIGVNGFGCSDTTTAVVMVIPTTTIITQLKNDTVCVGSGVTFTVSASGSDLIYTWQKNDTTLSGRSSDTLNIPSATLADSGVYSVIISGTCGTDTSTATLKVNGPPGNIILDVNGSNTNNKPDSIGLCAGEPLIIYITNNNLNLSDTIQWQKNDTTIQGQTTYIYTIPAVTGNSGGVYRAIVTGPCGADTSTFIYVYINGNTAIDTLTVNDSTITSKLRGIAICDGSSATFSVKATGSHLTYQWQHYGVNLPGDTSATYTIPSTILSDSGRYDVIVTGTCGADTSYAYLRIHTKPVITSQPSSQSMCGVNGQCGGFSLCVQATGVDLHYQWYFDGRRIEGANDSCYSVSPATFADTGRYRVIVSNQCGSDTSNVAIFKLFNAPSITSQPTSVNVCEVNGNGGNVSFCVQATGVNLHYQWYFDGRRIEGANDSCYLLNPATLADTGRYRVIVTNECGSDTSNLARLTIHTPPVITCQPKGESLCSVGGKCGGNGGVTFCVTATGNNLTYQWQYNGVNIYRANSSCYTINPVTLSDSGRYDVIVSNACGSDTSNNAVLTIGSSPYITSQPVCVSVCSGSSATFCVTATGSNLTYQWLFNGKPIKGADSSCHTIPSATSYNAGCYSVVVSNSCGSVTSYNATLTINTPPVITCQPKGESLCATNGKCGGNDGVTFCVTATGSNLTYQWQYNGRNIYRANSSCYTINPVTSSDSGRYDVIVSNSCGSDTSSNAVLNIGNSPYITSQPVCVAVCSGSTATFCVTATGSNLTYQWQFNGKNIRGANSSCYTIQSATSGNAGCYDVIVSNSCNSVTSNTATLTISTPPSITCQPQGQSLCSSGGKCGGSNGVTFCVTATGSNLSYQWQYNGVNIYRANSSCYTINPVNESNAGCYSVIVSNSCGSDTSHKATLTIGSSPDITSQPSCVAICSGGTATFCVTATGSNLTYQWQFNGKNISGANSCCYTIQSAASCNAGCYDVVVSNSCGSVTSSTATLTINAPPSITCQPQGQTLCETNGKCGGSDGVTFCVTATGSNLSYQWQYNGKNIDRANSCCYTINPVSSSNAGCYDVIVSNSCTSVTSNTATLTIGSTPDITSQPSCLSLCLGNTATFCVTATGSNLTYQWQLNGKNICGATSSCYTIESVETCNAGCYDVIVSNDCGSTTSSNATLTVNNCTTCNVPTDLSSSDVTCNSAVLSWSYSSSASSFIVEYRVKGCSTWTTKTVTSNSLTLTCLESGTTYEWSVNENCSCGSSSGYSSVAEFCTSSNCCSGNNSSSPRGDGDNNGNDNHLISDVKVYPNPTFSLTTVHATFGQQSDVNVMVTDITGRIIMSENETAPAGDYTHQFDMSKQAQGTYFLIIRTGDQMVTSKIVKIE